MGMGAGQVLRRIEIPLALPVIVAGIRIAAVTVISVAVVAAYINAGGLGTSSSAASATTTRRRSGPAPVACVLAVAVVADR